MKSHDRIIVRREPGVATPSDIVLGFARDMAAFASMLLAIGGVGILLLALHVPQ